MQKLNGLNLTTLPNKVKTAAQAKFILIFLLKAHLLLRD
ncbi:hypothetical protein CSUNSWCD_806 [Campylobacter showae CSUNSWCD]|uniref:Uncharacterized protein n=1 Tax=Campylobacter showae CSUNSWCD TaxID=1244083 RepID=M5II36_9BACT|nr:hypothetical protein CSUNSWCD_806 [Campylobacter showae CSUNSWCD]